MPSHTALQQKKVPVRCTSSTFAKSAISILPNDLSRKMPALAQSRSTRLHSLVARSTIALTCSKSETSARSATATPPALRISSTTVSAGVSDPPLPSRAPPKSLTTTLAPRLASPSACARPRPLPAPVTMATRPSNLIVMGKIPCFFFPSPLVGEGGARSASDEGSVSAERTPHPASLREATLSHKRRGNFPNCRLSYFISRRYWNDSNSDLRRLHIGSKIAATIKR